MFYRITFVVLVCAAFGWNVWRYPVVEQILTGGAAVETRYLRDDLPESSPRTATLLWQCEQKLRSLVKGGASEEDKKDAQKDAAPASPSTPRKTKSGAATPSTTPSDSGLLPPLPQESMPIPKASSPWASASPASAPLASAPPTPLAPHSLAESELTPLLASQFVESSSPPIPPPATTPPSSSEPPPLVVSPPTPLAGGVWMPPAL